MQTTESLDEYCLPMQHMAINELTINKSTRRLVTTQAGIDKDASALADGHAANLPYRIRLPVTLRVVRPTPLMVRCIHGVQGLTSRDSPLHGFFASCSPVLVQKWVDVCAGTPLTLESKATGGCCALLIIICSSPLASHGIADALPRGHMRSALCQQQLKKVSTSGFC